MAEQDVFLHGKVQTKGDRENRCSCADAGGLGNSSEQF